MRSQDVFSYANKNFSEYMINMEKYAKQLRQSKPPEFGNLFNKVSEYQTEMMCKMLDQYRAKIGKNKAKQTISEMVENVINSSRSGSVVFEMGKEEAEKVYSIVFDEIGWMLLDDCDFYHYPTAPENMWTIDLMFGGLYVPYWDGWED